MMAAAWLVLATVAATPPAPSTARAATPVISGDVYELSLPVSGAQLVQAERFQQGARWVVFIPGDVHPVRVAKRYSAGPVRSMRMRSVAHGLVVTLTPDPDTKLTLQELQLLATPQAHLRVARDTAVAPPVAATAPVVEPAPVVVVPAQPTEPVKKLSAPATLKALPMVCTLIVGGLIMGWLWWRKKNLAQAHTQTIELLAVRAFGTKHKLALIETCGERLLLAISDRQVTLLSHLTSASLDIMQADTDAPAAQLREDDAVGATVTPIRPVSDDVQGLLKIYQGTG